MSWLASGRTEVQSPLGGATSCSTGCSAPEVMSDTKMHSSTAPELAEVNEGEAFDKAISLLFYSTPAAYPNTRRRLIPQLLDDIDAILSKDEKYASLFNGILRFHYDPEAYTYLLHARDAGISHPLLDYYLAECYLRKESPTEGEMTLRYHNLATEHYTRAIQGMSKPVIIVCNLIHNMYSLPSALYLPHQTIIGMAFTLFYLSNYLLYLSVFTLYTPKGGCPVAYLGLASTYANANPSWEHTQYLHDKVMEGVVDISLYVSIASSPFKPAMFANPTTRDHSTPCIQHTYYDLLRNLNFGGKQGRVEGYLQGGLASALTHGPDSLLLLIEGHNNGIKDDRLLDRLIHALRFNALSLPPRALRGFQSRDEMIFFYSGILLQRGSSRGYYWRGCYLYDMHVSAYVMFSSAYMDSLQEGDLGNNDEYNYKDDYNTCRKKRKEGITCPQQAVDLWVEADEKGIADLDVYMCLADAYRYVFLCIIYIDILSVL